MADKKTIEELKEYFDLQEKSESKTREQLEALKESQEIYKNIAGNIGKGHLRNMQLIREELEARVALQENESKIQKELDAYLDQRYGLEKDRTDEQEAAVRRIRAMSLDSLEKELGSINDQNSALKPNGG